MSPAVVVAVADVVAVAAVVVVAFAVAVIVAINTSQASIQSWVSCLPDSGGQLTNFGFGFSAKSKT